MVPSETPASRSIQTWAQSVVSNTPGVPGSASLIEDRYWVTDLLDDFRDERTAAELRAVACKLYPLVCNFVLKSRGSWLGSGKTLPGLVERAAPDISKQIESAFECFFKTGERRGVLHLVEQILEPFGGKLFEGFRLDAPPSARVPASEVPWTRER